jgi:hypothetical protein
MKESMTEPRPLPPTKPPKAPLSYPVPAMQSLIDSLRIDIRFMRRWFDLPVKRNPEDEITEVTPATVLSTLEAIVESVEPALRFYLNYPTQRLSAILTHFIGEADECVAWLNTRTEASSDSSLSVAMYEQCCERLNASLLHWRHAIVCARALHQIDADTPEVQH